MGVGKKDKILDTQTTNNTGITSVVASGLLAYDGVILFIEEENTNAIDYQVEVTPAFYPSSPVGSDDSTAKWHVLLAWTALAKDGEIALAIGDAWDAVRLKARSTVSSAHGVVSAWLNRK